MKKISSGLLTLSFLLTHALSALPLGNPSEPTLLCDGVFQNSYFDNCYSACPSWSDFFPFRIGFYGDYVYNRHMKVDGGGFNDPIDTFEVNTNAAYFAVSLLNYADLFVTLGTSELAMHSHILPFAALDKERKLHVVSGTFFSWSVGTRATVWQCNGFSVGAEGQFFAAHPTLRRITSEIAPHENVNAKGTLYFEEWQLGLGLSYQYRCFIPYLGVQYARARTVHDPQLIHIDSHEIHLWNLKSKNPVGMAIGASLAGCSKALITVEGRFFNENALYINGQMRF